eukprot:366192-Chlamydomonas_euryale.AAC.11
MFVTREYGVCMVVLPSGVQAPSSLVSSARDHPKTCQRSPPWLCGDQAAARTRSRPGAQPPDRGLPQMPPRRTCLDGCLGVIEQWRKPAVRPATARDKGAPPKRPFEVHAVQGWSAGVCATRRKRCAVRPRTAGAIDAAGCVCEQAIITRRCPAREGCMCNVPEWADRWSAMAHVFMYGDSFAIDRAQNAQAQP